MPVKIKQTRLSQETFQLPQEHKERVTEVASIIGSFRGGEPSRSMVYKEMVAYSLDNLQAFFRWREEQVQRKFKGGQKIK